jgi:hypothetical protein
MADAPRLRLGVIVDLDDDAAVDVSDAGSATSAVFAIFADAAETPFGIIRS